MYVLYMYACIFGRAHNIWTEHLSSHRTEPLDQYNMHNTNQRVFPSSPSFFSRWMAYDRLVWFVIGESDLQLNGTPLPPSPLSLIPLSSSNAGDYRRKHSRLQPTFPGLFVSEFARITHRMRWRPKTPGRSLKHAGENSLPWPVPETSHGGYTNWLPERMRHIPAKTGVYKPHHRPRQLGVPSYPSHPTRDEMAVSTFFLSFFCSCISFCSVPLKLALLFSDNIR